ncbi:hypothetical protein BFJ63_vAg6765 [Fusarium oxysporum f. sp. narcissi]|uniref:Uncharacterized protein n=2 Tax=Fusarium oxysporum TaxID=5507 RepID=A0A4V1S109_FUSOX|nr:hypothetical protein BFJ65_g4967 [Fusarium oxysporum f. sp. cepae]RKK35771.1 hypothetical protein BFJ66_g13814 [Fusarium oxysporum f. sp. cepae]RKK41972.1 hypothetical protein BFJ67_g10292 [Fusarium oxysporum f. sp. cepae]RYC90469.1 hypothetical protein BFJ63_vAg6765 [Fusarium oxysporum f. sp. narcissi]
MATIFISNFIALAIYCSTRLYTASPTKVILACLIVIFNVRSTPISDDTAKSCTD